ncbi:MAG: cation:dicarboxylase symporter family transporter [Mogibacterium sp.]|nr:cation:dicarboxylase symporter family transporter [Mogibacterium sp.]
MKNKREIFELTKNPTGEAVEFVQRSLEEYGIAAKAAIKGTLVAEEAIASLVAHAEKNGTLRVNVRKLAGSITVEMSAPGSDYSLTDAMTEADVILDSDVGEEMLESIRNIMLTSLADGLKFSHKNGYNNIRITIEKNRKRFLYLTLAALIAGTLVGVVLSLAGPDAVNGALNGYILTPVKTMYINALKIIVAPVVFFSIVTCISGFSDLNELGRIGGRTTLMYLFTTLIAVAVGAGSYYLFRPGTAGGAAAAAAAASGPAAPSGEDVELSAIDMIVDIVPSNFVKPFLENNMAQLIFLAVLCGIAVGMIGKYSEVLIQIFEALNELFMKITAMIIRLMPVAVFCSMSSMVIDLGVKTILSIFGMFATFLFGLACMLIIYIILMILIGRLDPRPFIRKYAPVMLQIFSMASSNASIPLNMEVCDKKLGVSSKVYSLSIPLGATLNMDGTCVQLMVFALALAKVYGVTVTGSALLMMAFTVVILSMGAPGIPGAGVICLSVLLEQLGVPTEAVGLVMGIGPLIGMFLCMCNCTGDTVITTIVAKSVGELDIGKYNSR